MSTFTLVQILEYINYLGPFIIASESPVGPRDSGYDLFSSLIFARSENHPLIRAQESSTIVLK